MNQLNAVNNNSEISRRKFLQGSLAVVGATALGRVPAVMADGPVRFSGLLIDQKVIDVTDPAYGAIGDGQENDRQAFQKAIDAAIAGNLPLFIPSPPAFYRIGLEPNTRNLRVSGDLTIIGEARSTTRVVFTVENADPSKNYAGFFVPGGVNFRASNLRIEEDLHQSGDDFEFMGIFFESGAKDHTCVVENVTIEGFTYCLYTPASGVDGGLGELTLEVRNCDLHPWWQYAVAFWAIAGGHKRLHIYDSYLHDNQYSHLIYCHPHNSVHIENTRFDGATAWAFQFQGSAVAGDPRYQRFVGCWFGPRNSRGIVTQDRADVATTVEIRNCIFEGRPAIQIRSDILIEGCYFASTLEYATDTPFVAAYSNAPWKATMRNCIFAPQNGGLPIVDFRLEGVEAEVDNCQFYNQGSGAMLALGSGAGNTYVIRNSFFYNRADNGAQATSIEIDNGQAVIDSCNFFGRTIHDRGVIFCRTNEKGPSPDSLLQLNNCIFSNISGGSLIAATEGTATSWSNKIYGGNNRIINLETNKPLLFSQGGSPVYGHLAPVVGQAPAPLLGSSMLVISSNYDTYQVIGTADINTINWWAEDGSSNLLFSGEITLVAGMPFSLVTGGNIQLAELSGRRDVAAGTSIRLSYTSSEGVWNVIG